MKSASKPNERLPQRDVYFLRFFSRGRTEGGVFIFSSERKLSGRSHYIRESIKIGWLLGEMRNYYEYCKISGGRSLYMVIALGALWCRGRGPVCPESYLRIAILGEGARAHPRTTPRYYYYASHFRIFLISATCFYNDATFNGTFSERATAQNHELWILLLTLLRAWRIMNLLSRCNAYTCCSAATFKVWLVWLHSSQSAEPTRLKNLKFPTFSHCELKFCSFTVFTVHDWSKQQC